MWRNVLLLGPRVVMLNQYITIPHAMLMPCIPRLFDQLYASFVRIWHDTVFVNEWFCIQITNMQNEQTSSLSLKMAIQQGVQKTQSFLINSHREDVYICPCTTIDLLVRIKLQLKSLNNIPLS